MGMLKFRRAVERDQAALKAIFDRCIQEADWLDEASKQRADYDKVTNGELLFLAEDTDTHQILGFVGVWEPGRFIHHLYVHPEAQSGGVGTFLLDQLSFEVELPWQLKCVIKNYRARMFYDARGWRFVEKIMEESGECELLQFG